MVFVCLEQGDALRHATPPPERAFETLNIPNSTIAQIGPIACFHSLRAYSVV